MLDHPEDRGVLDRFAFFVARMAPLTLVLVALATLAVGLGIGFAVGRLAQGDKAAPPAPTALAAIGPLPVAPAAGEAAHQYQPPPLPRPAETAPPLPADVAPPVQTAPAPSETPAGEKGALPAEFRDLLASDGPGFVMEERLPDDAYVHKPQVKPTVKTAALAPVPRFPEGPAESSGLPWKTYGVAAGKWSKPAIALVIDDMGLDRVRTEKVRKLAGPLTLAYLAYADGLAGQMRGGRKAGHEILMHMPMEPLDAKVNPGPGALKVGLSDDEILTRLRRNLDGGAEFVGINNHMGSRFTADSRGMTLVMGELKKRGLLWLDSMTSANSVGLTLAEMAGVPHIGRTVFLDNLNDQAAVARQLAKLEAAARQHGVAVGIGHPRDGTIGALSVWLPALAAKGITLVPISALVTTKDAELAHARPSGKTASTSPSTD